MKKLIFIFVVIILFCSIQKANAQNEHVSYFDEQHIENGIIWRQVHTRLFFDSWQFINLIEIDADANWECTIAFTDEKKGTTALAIEHDALLAVNAGFFDVKNGGSVSYLKVDGEVVDSISRSGRMIDGGVFATAPVGDIVIDWSQPIEFYTDDRFYDDVLLSGPMLIKDGRPVPQDTSRTFVTNRHPRTCACLDDEEDLWLITIDGRNEQAAGMSLLELQEYLATLNCLQAVNLDGGGSTTMWINGKGIVNHPSDNKQFDSAGERAVANVILVKKR
jgi:exopolysaccharide biosynthesis protein